MTEGKSAKFELEWDLVRLRVIERMKKIGHDIPLAGYNTASELEAMTRRKRLAGINKRGKS